MINSQHVWASLEEQLQTIRQLAIESKGQRSHEVCDAIKKINHFILRDAARILNSPKLRRFQRSADDAVQQFWTNMLAVGFWKYDPARAPLFAYAYRVLSRACRDGVRGPRGRLMYPLVCDCPDQSKPLKRLGIKESYDMPLYKAVRELPFNYRRAILLKYWFEVTTEEGAERCGVCIATYNTWVYQGRLGLRERLAGWDWPDAA
jgi:DNA-directed RNA polymerase specialized sigma24 family protein